MDTTQQGVIALLKSAITGEKTALPEQFDIGQAYPVLRHHSITAMGYAGAVNCGIDKTQPIMQKLRMDYAACLLKSQGQMEDIARIYQAFEQEQIDYMPLKGCNMKLLYPNHELRVMGDADILIRREQYESIRCVMQRLGFAQKQETDHEWVWESKALYLELHKRLIPKTNGDYYRYYGDGWQLARKQQGCRYAMTDEDQFVYLFTHFAKHYRNGGVGCRHVVDLWIYLRTHPELDEGYIQNELEALQLYEFYRNILRLLQAWFGEAPWDEITKFMTQVIFANGNWGNAKTHALAEFVRSKKGNNSAQRGKLLWLVSRIFPPRGRLIYQYPVLKKWPVLLPAVWIWRCFYAAFFRRAKLRRDYQYLTGISHDEIETQEQALAYVGLRFGE